MSDRSVLWMHAGGRRINLCLEGESPAKYYDSAPIVRVTAGERELGRFSPRSDFDECVAVPPEALETSNNRVAIESSLTHVPAERDGVADRRRLGLRIYSVKLAYLEIQTRQ
jgi:hypothetical protein